MDINRRDLLKLAGGSALGVILSPLPWKLLDDSAIWTQNWSITPKLAHGPVTFRYSACTLCSAGCALQARCVGNIPVAVAGIPAHPLTRGALCPVGLSSHHLSRHPLRLAGPVRIDGASDRGRVNPVDLDSTLVALGETLRSSGNGIGAGTVAVLDRQPGRALSIAYREFLAGFPEAAYLVPSHLEDETTNALRAMAAVDPGPMGLDFTGVETVLSFGAPVLDGWGTPGAMMELFKERRRLGLRFIQVETRPSRTAIASDRWLRIVPGTERDIAWGIARVLVDEKLVPPSAVRSIADYPLLVKRIHEIDVSRIETGSGIPRAEIAAVAREISSGLSVVIAGSDPAGGSLDPETRNVIALLNLLLAPSGPKGGFVLRNAMPDAVKGNIQPAMSLDAVRDHSLRLLIVDSAESGYVFSPEMMRRKMRPNDGKIVVLASTLSPLAAAADFIIPVAASFEKLDEAPHPPSAVRESFSLALPLHPERAGAGDPLSFLVRLAAAADRPLAGPTTMESLLRRRADAIHASRRGTIYLPSNRSTLSASDLGSADMLWGHLQAGGCWMDDPQKPQPRGTFRFPVPHTEQPRQAAADREIVLMPFGWKGATASAHVSPIMSKLFQESALRELDGIAVIAPATAAEHGLENGKFARIATARGTKEVRVRCDAAAREGVVHVCVGPRPNGQDSPSSPAADELLSLCETANDGTWRITMATIEKG